MGREGRAGMRFVDRLVLLVAWIITCGLVYLLGLYVGKGAQEHRLGLEERLVRLPVTATPPPEGQRPKSDSEFVFYDKLMGEHPGSGHEPPRPVAVEPSHAPPTPPAAAGPAPAAAPKRAAAPPSMAVASRGAPTRSPAAPRRSSRPEAPPAPPEAPGPASVAARAPFPPPAAPPAGSAWTVLASPTRDREEADAVARQLRARGYDASLVRVVRDGGTWYRVQVGRFTTSAQATEVMRRLREHEGVTHVFVAAE